MPAVGKGGEFSWTFQATTTFLDVMGKTKLIDYRRLISTLTAVVVIIGWHFALLEKTPRNHALRKPRPGPSDLGREGSERRLVPLLGKYTFENVRCGYEECSMYTPLLFTLPHATLPPFSLNLTLRNLRCCRRVHEPHNRHKFWSGCPTLGKREGKCEALIKFLGPHGAGEIKNAHTHRDPLPSGRGCRIFDFRQFDRG